MYCAANFSFTGLQGETKHFFLLCSTKILVDHHVFIQLLPECTSICACQVGQQEVGVRVMTDSQINAPRKLLFFS